MEARVAEVRADGARRSKGIRSFEKFPVSRDALDKFEPGGEPSSPKFLIGARVNEEGQTWFSFERCCIETCASYFHPVIVFLFSLFFLFPAFLHVSLPLFSGKQEFQTGGCSRGTEMGVNSDPIVQRQIRWRARVREISGGGRA